MPEKIILVDLNGTLVDSSINRNLSTEDRIERETYRTWLIELLVDWHVVMITGRPDKYRERTLMQMAQICGWNPQESYFNTLGMPPGSWKNYVLQRVVFTRHSPDPKKYFAIENDRAARVLYRGYGIRALEYSDLEIASLLLVESPNSFYHV